jgi:hypothetical protein
MENDDDFTKSINRQVSFDLIFPLQNRRNHQCTDDNAEKEFFRRSSFKALDTVAGIFDRCGFTTFYLNLINRS